MQLALSARCGAAGARCGEADADGDELGKDDAHRAFHAAIVALAGNRQLDLAMEPILLKLQRPMAVNLRREASLLGPQAGLRRHERLLAALESNDPRRRSWPRWRSTAAGGSSNAHGVAGSRVPSPGRRDRSLTQAVTRQDSVETRIVDNRPHDRTRPGIRPTSGRPIDELRHRPTALERPYPGGRWSRPSLTGSRPSAATTGPGSGSRDRAELLARANELELPIRRSAAAVRHSVRGQGQHRRRRLADHAGLPRLRAIWPRETAPVVQRLLDAGAILSARPISTSSPPG